MVIMLTIVMVVVLVINNKYSNSNNNDENDNVYDVHDMVTDTQKRFVWASMQIQFPSITSDQFPQCPKCSRLPHFLVCH